MGFEIERKFFFDPAKWRSAPLRSTALRQGYLADTGAWEVCLREENGEHRSTLSSGSGQTRTTWESRLTAAEFDDLWPQTEGRRLVTTREMHHWKGQTFEVDHYGGALEGLVVVEVKFADRAAARSFRVPRAFGPELTYDPRFRNRALADQPGTVPRKEPDRTTPGWAYGALPFRQGPQGPELVVVTTRRQDRWIFPKGQPEHGMSFEKVALNEAREEAGITGKVVGPGFLIPYRRENGTVNLLLFPILVTALAERWLELGQRERQVIPIGATAAYGEVVEAGAQWLRDQGD